MAMLAFVAGGIVRATFPFGDVSRSTNDLGNQIVPVHAYLWDVLHGHADLFLDWRSGFGVPALPDLVTYAGSPLSLLVGLFPRDRVDLAVFVITVVKLGLAAAAMTVFLRRLRPGRTWLAVLLGASYGICGWALDDAAYVPMWLDGLIALPVFGILGLWARERRRFVVSALLVALFWASNFYTAYMATLAGGLLLLVLLLAEPMATRDRLVALVRHVGATVIGIGLAAVVLLPTVWAAREAQPAPPGTFVAVGPRAFVSRLLPASEGVGESPSLFVGTLALLLALTLPLNRRLTPRMRGVWTAFLVLLPLSLQWAPTQLAWHLFDTPQGSAYRQAFVVAGALVVAAWVSAGARWPDRFALGSALLALAALAVLSAPSRFVSATSFVLLGAGAVVLVAVVTFTSRAVRRRPAATEWLAAVVLGAFVLVEGSASAVVVDQLRAPRFNAGTFWGPEHSAVHAAVQDHDDWPAVRTEPGTHLSANDPRLLGGQGGSYYSSLMPASTSRLLRQLGFGWWGYGRRIWSLDNPATDTVFAVGQRVHLNGDPPAGAAPDQPRPVSVTSRSVPGLVTVHGDLAPLPAEPTAFDRANALLGRTVYDVPAVEVTPVADVVVPPWPTGHRLARTGSATAHVLVATRCAPGTEAFFWAPSTNGWATLGSGEPVPLLRPEDKGPGSYTGAPLVDLGPVPASGRVVVAVAITRSTTLPTHPVGCLEPAALEKASQELAAHEATSVNVTGHGLTARLPGGSTGWAVVAVPATSGWSCGRDGQALRRPSSYLGLLTVPLDEAAAEPTVLRCTFRPRYLPRGLGVSTASALLLGALAVSGGLVRRRQQRSPDAGRAPSRASQPSRLPR